MQTAQKTQGNGPPKDWEPTKVWDALADRPKPSAVIDLPIKTYRGQALDKVRIQVLRRDEQTRARLAARARVIEVGRFQPEQLESDPVAAELLQTYSALETLAIALVTVNGVDGQTSDGRPTTVYGRVFRSSEDIERCLHDDEITTLWAQYLSVQRERGPLVTSLSEDEIDAWIATLKEAADALPLARLTWPALAELCLSLAHRLGRSIGSSPDSSPCETSPDGQESDETRSQTGTPSSGEPPVAPGLVTLTPDDGSVPLGAEPDEAAFLVRSIE